MSFNLAKNRSLSNGIRFVRCGECGLSGHPLEVGGNGKRGILVVLERPTEVQIQRQNWFAGGDNTTLRTLAELGLNLSEDIRVTAVLPCAGKKDQNKYEACALKLQNTIESLKPMCIIAVGGMAAGAVCRLYDSVHFGENCSTQQCVGQCIPLVMKWDCWFAPVFSDKDIHTNKNLSVQQVSKDWVRRHLEIALSKTERPVREYDVSCIDLLYNTDEIIEAIEQAKNSQYAAFDYETNCLSALQIGAKVLSASICMGDSEQIDKTVAFPMTSEVVRRKWIEFLNSDTKKIAANAKFEEMWNISYFNNPAKNWFADCCVLARVLDCMPGNSGLKYCTFTQMGELYAGEVASYTDGEDGGFNRLHDFPIEKLLRYNGADAYFTFCLTKKYHNLLGLSF